MKMLTTLLLADAVEKGGPGSGPRPGSGNKTPEQASVHAYSMTQNAIGSKSKYDHERAAQAHEEAAKAHQAAGNASRAVEHEKAATRHYAESTRPIGKPSKF